MGIIPHEGSIAIASVLDATLYVNSFQKPGNPFCIPAWYAKVFRKIQPKAEAGATAVAALGDKPTDTEEPKADDAHEEGAVVAAHAMDSPDGPAKKKSRKGAKGPKPVEVASFEVGIRQHAISLKPLKSNGAMMKLLPDSVTVDIPYIFPHANSLDKCDILVTRPIVPKMVSKHSLADLAKSAESAKRKAEHDADVNDSKTAKATATTAGGARPSKKDAAKLPKHMML